MPGRTRCTVRLQPAAGPADDLPVTDTARAALAAQLAATIPARPSSPAPAAIVRPHWLRRLDAGRP